jgi:hypothetical protein
VPTSNSALQDEFPSDPHFRTCATTGLRRQDHARHVEPTQRARCARRPSRSSPPCFRASPLAPRRLESVGLGRAWPARDGSPARAWAASATECIRKVLLGSIGLECPRKMLGLEGVEHVEVLGGRIAKAFSALSVARSVRNHKRKKARSFWLRAFLKKIPATSYSPTRLPVQYHRLRKA